MARTSALLTGMGRARNGKFCVFLFVLFAFFGFVCALTFLVGVFDCDWTDKSVDMARRWMASAIS